MIDYSDGKIHGWNGGARPVHLQSEVRVWFREDDGPSVNLAEAWLWYHSDNASDIIAFQVTRAHRTPRRFWIKPGEPGQYPTLGDDNAEEWRRRGFILVEEVLP
ncbi:hypothetical protein BV509_00975 [Rhodovulum sulfidophilum]|uniref:Uncharacterized protein n=1 Tax=Rhodovulum visakhapatnamense TaxID=364297 RepID=A0ABS1RGY3_9RHOB|nr:hypothetical protein [Rhodovulum visakhapatnamense]MBL3569908.1 hypothetical protein [Rhodovulum visakhapatnamense]MBL3578399.1 hypothetical protein [Rhodovulum visakhapatnamense]OLS43061.1 hypothetical protein BV509_00975 [Rhodovulum sulfidophilum]